MNTINTIISASRRTDIPTFYYDWLQNCLSKQHVLVANPLYPANTSIIDLRPESVHSIVLWSKDMSNVLSNPGLLNDYNLYFQYTVTGYNKALEPNTPSYADSLKTIEGLRKRYSAKQFNIRFDPIIISTLGEPNPVISEPYKARINAFHQLCEDLKQLDMQDCRITVSFLSVYNKVATNMKSRMIDFVIPDEEMEIKIMRELAEIAKEYNQSIYTCANDRFLTAGIDNVFKGHCIDGKLLTELFGKCTNSKDSGQREECGCAKSRDIGLYSQKCKHGCVYCYA